MSSGYDYGELRADGARWLWKTKGAHGAGAVGWIGAASWALANGR